MTKNSKILFIVQGEGRGHLTQAIALLEILRNAGYKDFYTLVGISKFRKIPDFFYNNMTPSIVKFRSPNFIRDKKNQSIRIFISLLFNLFKCRQYFKSLRLIHKNIKEFNPDLILNFYEPITGLYSIFYKPKTQIISIGHQYYYQHPDFKFPQGGINKFFLKQLTKITAIGSIKKLAIHIEHKKDYLQKNIRIIPPLIRPDILNHKIENKGHLCIYLLNPGYSKEIIDWHNKNNDKQLYCYWDNEEKDKVYKYDESLTFYQINDQAFIDHLATSEGLLTTAGYESVCEAMYFGKPVLMVPVGKHYEQFVNSQLFESAGAGISASSFDIDKFATFMNNFNSDESFRNWIKKTPQLILKIIEETLGNQDRFQ